MRVSTSVNQASGSTSFIFADWINVATMGFGGGPVRFHEPDAAYFPRPALGGGAATLTLRRNHVAVQP
jgi:hypothetical protein